MQTTIPKDAEGTEEQIDKYLLEPALRRASWRPRVTAPMMAPESTPEKPTFVVDCPLCLGLRVCFVRLTVKRMPFLYCRFCYSRVFINSFSGLKVVRERHPETCAELERLMALPVVPPTPKKAPKRRRPS